MNNDDLPDDSDSSDEDYVPNEKVEDLPSEIDEDDSISESEETSGKSSRKKKKSRKKIVKDKVDNKNEAIEETKSEETKANVDDLWADFVKDTGFKTKGSIKSTQPTSLKPKENIIKSSSSSQSSSTESKPANKVKVTQIFEFAGEEVKVEKEVSADSAEARLLGTNTEQNVSGGKSKRSAGLGGIGNVLNQLTKKPKISTLEKTKLDWDSYKREHDIEEELQTFNKGKDGYLERQDFLQRTDVRRFEIEKGHREVERNKRFNSAQ
ncbi:craniofacial development protein 1 [Diabrotica virgifera virgifera]|uniref:Craniofacial development protein 1 n=1 Tax=Diabrotica virgifera virgifera TaxID=50390 RepID=A0A6P7FGW3_DIAVI|nr:craniofacial development protein 1 [Diabrotica virgifera virgifera]